MRKQKWDTIPVGLIIGTICPLIILFGMQVYHFPKMSFSLFLRTGFETGSLNPYLKLATMFNLAPFFMLININRYRTCQGIVFATILSGLFIVYFTLL
ncbi:hypothetical protein N9J07_03975 [Bacteroidia bacterium]|nr:hypothetical protein [Bacteroidia bacterium]